MTMKAVKASYATVSLIADSFEPLTLFAKSLNLLFRHRLKTVFFVCMFLSVVSAKLVVCRYRNVD